ncbi:hypothetical protein WJX82_000173 [Trebouxia sp. C0006]
MHSRLDLSSEAATRIHQLEQHVQQLQQEAQTAGALEYRCEGLLQEKQQLAQQLQHLQGNVVQMQSALHQERLLRQERDSVVAQSAAEKLEIASRCKDLQAKLRVAQERASEAEEEQLKMEQDLAATKSELESAQQISTAVDARSASSSSLPDDSAQLLQKLRGQVSSLKASRDKLLVEVDRQSLEIESLLTDNSALEQGLAHMQESAQRWEAQAQENLQHMDQLKSLLEESAFWQSQSAQLSTADADGSNSDHQRAPDEAQLQKEVLQEKARATGLEVQIRALCLELAHARENAGLLSQSIAPTLGNIGSRVAQLLQMKAVQQAVR